MKTYFYICVAAILCFSCKTQEAVQTTSTTGYDQALAEKLGADDYGMKTYVMAFLKNGPNRPDNEEAAAELQAAHMSNIKRLAEEGKLVLAGPFMGSGDLKGIYIFDVTTKKEAKLLTKTDPAIQAGSLVMELHLWYGSAGVMQVAEIGERVRKISF